MADNTKKADSKDDLVVLAPLVSIRDKGGRRVYLYRGSTVAGFDSDDTKRLTDDGLLGYDTDVTPNVALMPDATFTDQ